MFEVIGIYFIIILKDRCSTSSGLRITYLFYFLDFYAFMEQLLFSKNQLFDFPCKRTNNLQFWMWFIGPGFLYALERTIRIARGSQDTILQLAIAHPSKVLELQLKKSTFKYKPGSKRLHKLLIL